MKNLFIPPLGFEFVLAEPWTFTLFDEYRNETAMKHFGLPQTERYYYHERTGHQVTIQAGAILKIDRIFIRRGASDFDSVTFFMKGGDKVIPFTKGRQKAIRFWAKLADVNKIIIKEVA
jgi:hypothetical protein